MIKKVKIFGARQKVANTELVLLFLRSLMKQVPKSSKDLAHRKTQFSSTYKIAMIPNRDLIVIAQKNNLQLSNRLRSLLQKRAVRTISGVSPIGILTKPYPCPGKCIYCPTEDRMPKSYMANQPAAARALRNKFHPYKQVKNRIIALEESGHPVSKLEIIVMGGTWSFLPYRYQNWYIRKCYEAANSGQVKNNSICHSREVGNPVNNNLEIREVKESDWKEVLKLERVTLKEVGFENRPQITDFKKAQKYYEKLWVGMLNNKIMAMGGYKKLPLVILDKHNLKLKGSIRDPDKKNTAELCRVRVLPKFQNQGVGEELVQKILDEIETQGFKTVELNFTKKLEPKNSYFYAKFGFKKFKEEVDDLGIRLFFKKHFSTFDIRHSTFPNSLQNLQKINETASHRIIGLTLETRPDFITEAELARMRKYGCTRIEIGVQTLDDEVQKLTKRGHGRKHVARAMKLMKDYGFKVCFHLMPGLPGSNIEKDLLWMKEVFQNPDFCPDFTKLYPCVVIESAELSQWWKDGRYQPYDDSDLIKLLMQWQTFVPEWTRIMRLMRDIPVSNISAGAKFSNLRQIITDQPKKLREIVGDDFYDSHDLDRNNDLFRDIRAREIGFSKQKGEKESPILVRRDYLASDGLETFLSFESPDKKYLYALLRLRKPSDNFEPQFFRSVLKNAALIREVHSYGGEISVGEEKGIGQHRGLGRRLIEEAERIATKEWKMKKMTIIAGVGTREYYRKFGYEAKCTYMVKQLR